MSFNFCVALIYNQILHYARLLGINVKDHRITLRVTLSHPPHCHRWLADTFFILELFFFFSFGSISRVVGRDRKICTPNRIFVKKATSFCPRWPGRGNGHNNTPSSGVASNHPIEWKNPHILEKDEVSFDLYVTLAGILVFLYWIRQINLFYFRVVNANQDVNFNLPEKKNHIYVCGVFSAKPRLSLKSPHSGTCNECAHFIDQDL